jgi:SNF2 family DNA or RNA helicase
VSLSAAIDVDPPGTLSCTWSVEAATVALDRGDRPATRPSFHWRQPRLGALGAGQKRAPRAPSLVERLLAVLQPPLEILLEPTGPLDWADELYPFQRQGAHALFERPALLLADDMGLGKTVQAIAALRALVHLRRAENALVVVPAGLITQWRRELGKWAPELRVQVVHGIPSERDVQWLHPAHIYLTSYDTLRNDRDRPRGPLARMWDVVVLDEAQRIKNRETETSKVCKRLRRARAWALTGTPLENALDELGSVCEFLQPWEDENRPPPRLLDHREILAAHRDLQLRRKKSEVLSELPAKTVHDVWIDLAPEQRRAYERAERKGVVYLRELGAEATVQHVLALIQKLKQICNFCPETGASAKADDLTERVAEIAAEGEKVLVFSQFVDEGYGIKAIERRLRPLRPLVYVGGQSAAERDRVVDAFMGEERHPVLLLSLKAGGHGLNLHRASYIIHFDRWWNPAVERQAEDRVHRLGQTRAVTVYRYICADTIEERIDSLLRYKQELFDRYVDDVTIDLDRLLTRSEIFGLFGLEPPVKG